MICLIQDFSELSGLQLDALKEISNIGAGNAATALAQMLNAKIDISVPRVNILPFSEVVDLIGGADLHVTGIYFNVRGSAPSNILFILPVDKAHLLLDMLFNERLRKADTGDFSEIEVSAMMEVGNIISAAFLNAMSTFTQLTFIPSVPAFGQDMAGAILNGILAQFGKVADYILSMETEFKKDNIGIVGYFFLFPEPGFLDAILSALGVNF